MLNGITNSLQAIVILAIIGILIGVWILSGVVPTLLYYGLKILHPKIFLPATLIICSITSLATGSSWGTSGTIGIALIGIGDGLGFPLPVVAGAVLSGAYFGDKMSPLSDTTNMAPAMVGTDLYTHIKHMTYTTGVSYGLTLIIEIALGFFYGGGRRTLESVNQILAGIDAQFSVNPLLLLPPADCHGAGVSQDSGGPGHRDRHYRPVFWGQFFRATPSAACCRQPMAAIPATAAWKRSTTC
jgi:NhaC family Na+:H+ antiporter